MGCPVPQGPLAAASRLVARCAGARRAFVCLARALRSHRAPQGDPLYAGDSALPARPPARPPDRNAAALRAGAAFALSDHADFPSLLRFVELVQPKRVLTLHGFAREFAATLRARGIDA
ncbi:MAG: hypothetical protein HY736_09965, partial [Verrucomicrobia bacterium]|nr:hypothetical protein [Verrucomicrobiota bacterium]